MRVENIMTGQNTEAQKHGQWESNHTTRAKYVSAMAQARQERRKQNCSVGGDTGTSKDSSPASTNSEPASTPNGILKKSTVDAPPRPGPYSDRDSTTSSTTTSTASSSGEGSEKLTRMAQARAAKTAGRAGRGSNATSDDGSGGVKPDSGHLPKFGEWNENLEDPKSSGPEYTLMFNAASKERKVGGPVRVSAKPGSPGRTEDLYYYTPLGRRPKKKREGFFLCCIRPSAED